MALGSLTHRALTEHTLSFVLPYWYYYKKTFHLLNSLQCLLSKRTLSTGSSIVMTSRLLSPNNIKVIESRMLSWARHVARMGKNRNADGSGGDTWSKTCGRSRHRWKDGTKVNLEGLGWEVMDWIHLAHGGYDWRVLMNTIMNLQIPLNSMYCLLSLRN